jgi:hypothetical protein
MSDARQPLLIEIRELLGNRGCVLCALVQRSLQRYLSALAYESVTDVRERALIRAARGFCAEHGRMLRENRAALGSALIYRDVLVHLVQDLEGLETRGQRGDDVGGRLRRALLGGEGAAALPPRATCPACRRVEEAEQLYCDALAVGMDDGAIVAAFGRSDGLCAPHLRVVLRLARPQQVARLQVAQIAIWKALIDELDEFIRKQDHHFRHEPSGDEADSWRRAIDLVSGEPGLVD